jgi:hypothetical protein
MMANHNMGHSIVRRPPCAKTPIVKRQTISSCTEHYMWVGSYANMLTPPAISSHFQMNA